MIKYSVEFPAANGRTMDDFLDVARKWLVGSRHYPWNDPDELPASIDELTELSRGTFRVFVTRVSDGDRQLAGVRLLSVEEKQREWNTEIVGVTASNYLWISVRTFCDVLAVGSTQPDSKPPYVVKQLVEDLGGGDDGHFKVQSEPFYLKSTDVCTSLAVNLIQGNYHNHLPIVYVSADFMATLPLTWVAWRES